MGRPPCENGSCRDCVHKSMLLPELMCSVCVDHDQYSDRQLKRMVANGEIEIRGVCHQINGPLSQPTVEKREAANSSEGRSSRGRRASRRMETERYKPEEERKSSGKKRNREELTPYDILNALGVENSDININKGGTSQAAISKTKKTMGAAVTGLAKMVAPGNPDLARNLGVAASFATNPSIPPVIESQSNNNSAPNARAEAVIAQSAATAANIASRNASASKEKKMRDLEQEMGTALIDMLKNAPSPRESRPFLAAFASRHDKPTVEAVLEKKISDDEWNKIRKHALFPGAFEPVETSAIYRRKVPSAYLERLIMAIEEPGNIQRVAFGKKIAPILGGCNYVELDSIARSKPLMAIVTEFILALDAEALCRCRCPSRRGALSMLRKGYVSSLLESSGS